MRENNTVNADYSTIVLLKILTSMSPIPDSVWGCVVDEQYCRSGLPGDVIFVSK